MQKVKKVLLIILVVICASNYSFGQPKDVEGWNKARWGMTENEVLKVFEGKATAIEKPRKYQGLSKQWDAYSSIILDEIEIGKDKYTVDFIFDDKDKKLIMIIVSIKNKSPLELQFSSLEQMLTEKYGSPSFKIDSEGSHLLERERAWNFPSTIIELKYFDMRVINSKSLKVVYNKNLKETHENL